MIVYRLAREDEVKQILKTKSFIDVGSFCTSDKKNSHNYNENVKYLHFFKTKIELLYLNTKRNQYICVYDIPENVLANHFGYGKYADYINFNYINKVEEYAIPTNLLNFEYITSIEKITNGIDYENFFDDTNLKGLVKKIYCKKVNKEQVK